jgi:amino acid transporter
VIVTSMVAVSFGSYATSLFVGENAGSAWNHLFTSVLVVAMVAVNMVGTKVVAAAQSLIVTGVLIVFGLFIWVTIFDIDLGKLAFSDYPSFSKIIASVALTFFAFLGFNVITFAAGDLRDPPHDLPRAMYRALGITTLVYVRSRWACSGPSPSPRWSDTARQPLPRRRGPALGDAGFTIMAIAALLATAGATNATLYASSNLTGMLAEQRLFPSLFGRGSRLERSQACLSPPAWFSSSPTSSTCPRSRRSGALSRWSFSCSSVSPATGVARRQGATCGSSGWRSR